VNHLIVDGANVVGSRPDGWWHDRPGAARRLAEQLVTADLTGLVGEPLTVHLVLEGKAKQARDLLPDDPALRIVLAAADGDATIADLAAELAGEQVLVVTADRALRARVEAVGARTTGPGHLLRLLPGA
jgi:hypothetical protein